MLYHRYRLDADGTIADAKIVCATGPFNRATSLRAAKPSSAARAAADRSDRPLPTCRSRTRNSTSGSVIPRARRIAPVPRAKSRPPSGSSPAKTAHCSSTMDGTGASVPDAEADTKV